MAVHWKNSTRARRVARHFLSVLVGSNYRRKWLLPTAYSSVRSRKTAIREQRTGGTWPRLAGTPVTCTDLFTSLKMNSQVILALLQPPFFPIQTCGYSLCSREPKSGGLTQERSFGQFGFRNHQFLPCLLPQCWLTCSDINTNGLFKV